MNSWTVRKNLTVQDQQGHERSDTKLSCHHVFFNIIEKEYLKYLSDQHMLDA